MGGEEAEARFCEHKRLHMSTLRMTWEAKVQLKEILINTGFPEGTSALFPKPVYSEQDDCYALLRKNLWTELVVLKPLVAEN